MNLNLTQYCEVILNTDQLCENGRKCCFSSNNIGDKPPPNVIYVNNTRANHTKYETRTTPATPATTSQVYKKVVTVPVPTKPTVLKDCQGECVGTLLALICGEVDKDAYCPDEGYCCIESSEVNVNSSVFHTSAIATNCH